LILDLSDISKKYARRMEYLARVRDGSEDDLASGYWLLQIIFSALADGIKAYLFGQKRGLYGCFSSRDPETGQRWLFSP
jgi:hypothetical protein